MYRSCIVGAVPCLYRVSVVSRNKLAFTTTAILLTLAGLLGMHKIKIKIQFG
jgi:hypothetical protein